MPLLDLGPCTDDDWAGPMSRQVRRLYVHGQLHMHIFKLHLVKLRLPFIQSFKPWLALFDW